MQGEVPMMFEIVAVGAIASTFELRMPCAAIFAAQRRPVEPAAARHVDRLAALLLEQVDACPAAAGRGPTSSPRSDG